MSQAKAFQQSTTDNTENHQAHLAEDRDFHGAAIIGENGEEIPITEDMILQACNDLSCSWIFPRQAQKH